MKMLCASDSEGLWQSIQRQYSANNREALMLDEEMNRRR